MGNSIIKLKNVSKFYYNKGVIASGVTKVNLEFKIGEFVCICGESGSGKSTLLNVISGLDTYEEGEMYIDESETSHYTEVDFENYRRKYIGNIFQNFNLVNSYTVYQNIELVLLLNGEKRLDINNRVIDLIKEVGLYKFRNTKVSKLSGGQKQRVAIARALAKDTPIIIADEPTGNLDSKSAKGIISLLSKIARDKLVIIVTHNYDQFSDYATRKIRMHDGRVLEDRYITKVSDLVEIRENRFGNISFINRVRLGVRNAFNIIPKFLLLLGVYLFVVSALMMEYASFKHQEYIMSKSGYNYYFANVSDRRIVVKKEDKSSFNEDDYAVIEGISNVSSVIKNDLLLDSEIGLTAGNYKYYLYGNVNDISNLDGKIDKGRMPKDNNEVVVVGSSDDYYLGDMADKILNCDFYLENDYSGDINKNLKLKIVGIKYVEGINYNTSGTIFYVSEMVSKELSYYINQRYSDLQMLFKDKYYNLYTYNSLFDAYFRIVASDKVNKGEVYVSSDLNSKCHNNNCVSESLGLIVNNIYYEDKMDLRISKTYDKDNFNGLVGKDMEYNYYNGAIFVNKSDYDNLFNRDSYQISVFVSEVNDVDDTIKVLNDNGYKTLKVVDTLIKNDSIFALQVIRTIVTIVLVVVLFFVSYFIIRLILKSRNVYFTTLRMLGASRGVMRELVIIELLVVANLAYGMFLLMLYLSNIGVISISIFDTVLNYLVLRDYVLLYLILFVMSVLSSVKFAKRLFKKRTIPTMVEEV